MAAASQCQRKEFIGYERSQKRNITWQSLRSILYPCICFCVHTQMSPLNGHSTDAYWLISCILWFSLPFFSSCLRSFLVTWKLGKFFGLVSVFVQNITVLRESQAPEFPCRSNVTLVCFGKLERPVGSALWGWCRWKIQLAQLFSCHIVFPHFPCGAAGFPIPENGGLGCFFCQLCPLPRLEKRAPVWNANSDHHFASGLYRSMISSASQVYLAF